MVPPAERTPEMQKQMQDNYDLVISLLDTGMRYDEMAKLPWSSVDMDAGSIRIYRNKVDSADTFYMTGRLKEVMQYRHETAMKNPGMCLKVKMAIQRLCLSRHQ